MIENFDEVKTYFETNKDNKDVKGFVGGFSNLDVFKSKVNTDPNFKSYLDSEKDTHASKALKTWQENNLDKVYTERYNKEHPGADPKDLALTKLQTQLDNMQKDTLHKELTNKAYKSATEKKLPTDLVDFMVGSDEETTNANLEKLSKIFTAHDEAIRKEFTTNNSYTPPNGDPNSNLSEEGKLRAQIRKSMGIKEKIK